MMMSRESDNALELLLGPLPLPPPPPPLRRSRGWVKLESPRCDIKVVSLGLTRRSRDARAGKWDTNGMNMTNDEDSRFGAGAK